jgi:hypothetical protein
MALRVFDAALLRYLAVRAGLYHGKVLELREAVERWLSYVPHTFPHYTRHTVQHSDQIIIQLSKFLFDEEDHSRPIVNLSSVEAYILAAAAYLHDAGMVTPDQGKLEILRSDEWRQWTSDNNAGATRWTAIQQFRSGTTPPNDAERHFIADVQTRFLIAEFIRRVHHARATDVIRQHQRALARLSHGRGGPSSCSRPFGRGGRA